MTFLRVLLRRLKRKAMTVGADRVRDTVPARHTRGMSGGLVSKGTADDLTDRLAARSAGHAFFDAVDARRSLARGWDFQVGATGAAFWGQAEAYGPGDAEALFDDAEIGLRHAEEQFADIDWSQDLIG